MQRDDIRAAFEGGAEAAPVRPQHAGRVRLVDDKHAVVARRDFHEVGERRPVALHRVKAFDRDPRAACATLRAPVRDRVVERLGVVVARPYMLRFARAHSVVDAGVDQLVVDDEIAAGRERRKERVVREEAAREVKAGLRPRKRPPLRLRALRARDRCRAGAASRPRRRPHRARWLTTRLRPARATRQDPDSRSRKSRRRNVARALSGVRAVRAPLAPARGCPTWCAFQSSSSARERSLCAS